MWPAWVLNASSLVIFEMIVWYKPWLRSFWCSQIYIGSTAWKQKCITDATHWIPFCLFRIIYDISVSKLIFSVLFKNFNLTASIRNQSWKISYMWWWLHSVQASWWWGECESEPACTIPGPWNRNSSHQGISLVIPVWLCTATYQTVLHEIRPYFKIRSYWFLRLFA